MQTSPAADWELALGKFLGAWLFLALFIVLTGYMPLLILVNGHVALGHLLVGYLGLLLLGAGLTSVGVLASSLAPNQLLAAVIASGVTVVLFLCWVIAKKIEGPVGDLVGYLDLFDRHFRSLSRGILKSSTVVYLLSLTYLGLLATTQVLSQRRWRG